MHEPLIDLKGTLTVDLDQRTVTFYSHRPSKQVTIPIKHLDVDQLQGLLLKLNETNVYVATTMIQKVRDILTTFHEESMS